MDIMGSDWHWKVYSNVLTKRIKQVIFCWLLIKKLSREDVRGLNEVCYWFMIPVLNSSMTDI